MMSNTKKTRFTQIIAIAVLLAIISALSSTVAFASTDENISYLFTVKNYLGISRDSNPQWRSTSDNNNAWKVNFKTSEEPGNSTMTKFSLGLEEEDNLASNWYGVVVGTGAHYYAANNDGDFATVYLQAQNNNNNANSYVISGYWDEETGITPD